MKTNRNRTIASMTAAGMAAVTLLLTGCAGNPYMTNGQTADATGGALLGAVAGAIIGNQTGAGLAGAAIGAGIGGLAGAGMGNQQPPPVNNPQCPPGYTCVPTAPQYRQQYP